MSTGNELTIIGNLVEDPSLRFTSSGTAVCNMRIAWNPPPAKDGTERESTYLNVVAWRDLAENLAELRRGERVILSGHIQSRSYETRDGEKRTAVEMVADDGGRSLRFKPRADQPTARPADPWASTGGATSGNDEPPF